MNYIRMKDDCYEWITTFAEYDEARNKATELGLTYSRKIIKQADSIKKLCDEFVCGSEAYKDKAPFVLSHYELEAKIEFYHKIKCSIYGAIWTDKGLIYVAKMNDDGELELL